MTRRAPGVATGGTGCGVQLRGRVPDHWTYRAGEFGVTGWHWPVKGKPEVVEEPLSGRGVFKQERKRARAEQGKLL